MKTIELRVAGSTNKPIQIYWDIKDRKIDEYLLLMSITSGAYGNENFEYDDFIYLCDMFFKKAKPDNRFFKQFEYVLTNSNYLCAKHLNNLLNEKWKLKIEYKNENEAGELA